MTGSHRFAVLALALAAGLGASACDAPEQAGSCEQYTSCVRALDEQDGRETNLDRFDPGGACWNSTEQAHVCEQSCERGIRWISEHYPSAPEECQP